MCYGHAEGEFDESIVMPLFYHTEYKRQNADIYTYITSLLINLYTCFAYRYRQFLCILFFWVPSFLSTNICILPASPVTSSAIRTVDGRACVFPFVWRGQRYWSCTNAESTKEWCATEVGHLGTPTAIGICQADTGILFFGCALFMLLFTLRVYFLFFCTV